MPPRIPLRCLRAHSNLLRPTPSTFLSQPQQTRHASILGSLSDVPTAYNRRIRRGRGPSSGKGKTSGRGHKGQKQHGKVPFKFNGGQTPDEVVKGKRGFTNTFSLEMTVLNLDRVQSWIDQGRLDASRPITVKELHESRCTHGIKDGVKLLARVRLSLSHPVSVSSCFFPEQARPYFRCTTRMLIQVFRCTERRNLSQPRAHCRLARISCRNRSHRGSRRLRHDPLLHTAVHPPHPQRRDASRSLAPLSRTRKCHTRKHNSSRRRGFGVRSSRGKSAEHNANIKHPIKTAARVGIPISPAGPGIATGH